MRAVLATQSDLTAGVVTAERLTEDALARIADPAGEGGRTFTRVYHESALDTARALDRARQHGVVASPLAGVPVSIKDLFNVRGEPTPAGSTLLAHAPIAQADATIVARLRAAGAVIVGRTNMTEFAFSGIGYNPHYGTPRNPFERTRVFEHRGVRTNGRIPGGSSSGAAVSVTDGMALVGIGTDTGGSVRIPAALCGLTGFKPTARRVSRDGVFPLSSTLDSIGPLAPTVACCAVVDAILAGDAPTVPPPLPLAGIRLGVIRDFVLDDLDEHVARTFAQTLERLAQAGALLSDVPFPELKRLPAINRTGGFAGAEAFALHRPWLATRSGEYDPRVAKRIQLAGMTSAADYIDVFAERAAMIDRARLIATPFDAFVLPTVAITAPPIALIERDDDAFGRANGLVLRNTAVFNFLDGCSLSVPCHRPGDAPVGLMIAGLAGDDRRILQAGLAIEMLVAPITR